MPFQPGQSGNPQGKPKGARSKRLELFRSKERALQRKLLSMALDGDMAALKIISDRLWPRLRAEAAPIAVFTGSEHAPTQGRAVIKAGLRGQIPVDAVRDFLLALQAQAHLVEIAEFEDRLTELERSRTVPPWEGVVDESLAPRKRDRPRIRLRRRVT